MLYVIILIVSCYSFALDTAALLGGDEYLIQQILVELQKLEYNDNEKKVLRWALSEVRYIRISGFVVGF